MITVQHRANVDVHECPRSKFSYDGTISALAYSGVAVSLVYHALNVFIILYP